GEYGTIRLFSPDELDRRKAVGVLFEEVPRGMDRKTGRQEGTPTKETFLSSRLPVTKPVLSPGEAPPPQGSSILAALDPDQRAAAEITDGALLIIAGPGTGKTRTLTHRIAHLIAD